MPPTPRPSTRTRILDAADRLFTEQGIQAVGVDAIATTADVAKTTLYAHFGSKDGLIVAYLQRRAEQERRRLEGELAPHGGSAADRILHLYDVLAEELGAPGYRGSPFVNACVELGTDHPAAAVARAHRQWMLDVITTLTAETGAPDPGALAAQLLQLHQSATVAPLLAEGTGASAARAAAAALLSRQTPRSTASDRSTTPTRAGAGGPEAHRLVAFLNSAHLPDGDDQLADERAGRWLADWLAEASGSAPAVSGTVAAAPPELLVLREGLRQLAAVNCGAAADPHLVAQAAAVLERTPLLVDLAAGAAPRLTPPDGTSTETAMAVIAVVASDYLAVRARGEWPRLKVCASSECRWAFLDTTRNHRRRWCDMAGCGNRAKNRAWRRRQTPVTTKSV